MNTLARIGFISTVLYLTACASTEQLDAMTQPVPMDSSCDGELQAEASLILFNGSFGKKGDDEEDSPSNSGIKYRCVRHIDNESPNPEDIRS